jgi:hypothetical protein
MTAMTSPTFTEGRMLMEGMAKSTMIFESRRMLVVVCIAVHVVTEDPAKPEGSKVPIGHYGGTARQSLPPSGPVR